MKFNKIIAAIALPLMALFTSCEQDLEVASKVSTDKSVYAVEANGGEVTVKLLAPQDWTATVSPASSLDEVEGITVEPASGNGSSQIVEVIVKVPENKGYNRKANVSFVGETISGAITISQVGEKGERLLECSIAEFLKKPVDASVYYVLTGVVANSVNPDTYSNFDLVDPKTGDKVLIYGLAKKEDVSNQKIGLLKELGIEEGDQITIASTRGAYNGTPQGMKSYYISHKKSEAPMIKLGMSEVTAAKGSDFDLAVSSNMVTWTLSSNVSWLTFDPATGDKSTTVKVSVAEDGEGTEGVITLAAEGLESVSCKVTRTDIKDVTIAEFLEAPVGDKPYRIVAKIESIVNEQYGNLYAEDATGRVYVYGLTATKQAKNDKSFPTLGLRAGDIITIVGTRGQYADAKVEDQKEQVSGAYLEASCKSTDVTITEFLAKEVASKYLESPYYRLTGVIKEIVKEEYGNFYFKEEASETFVYVYGLTKAPVAKNDKSFASLGLKVGDKVTLVGQRGQYPTAKVEEQKEQVSNAYFISSAAGGDVPAPEKNLTVENAAVEVEATATSATFTVKSNVDWKVTKAEGDWITKFTESGSNDGTITVEFAANEGALRTAKFEVAGADKKVEITLTQKAAGEAPAVECKNLAELNAAILAAGEEGLDFVLNLSKPAVLTRICADNKTSYFQDETAGVMFYGYVMEGAFLGLTIEGVVKGTGVVYNGLPEVVAFYDISGARVGATATIPCTELTIAQLNADFNKYLNMQVKLTGVEVSEAFSNSDKNGKVKQGANELAIYVKTTEAFEAAQGSKADLVVFPAVFNANKQAYVWAADDYKPSVVGGQITLASKFTVNVGETVSLGATTNSTATIKYSSADEAIATVSADGVVTGIKEGEVEITASIDAVEGFTAAEAKTTIVVKPAGSSESKVYTLTFPDDNSANNAAGGYNLEWEAQKDGFAWTISAFNNNKWGNEWKYIRGGSKKFESTPSIATKTVMPEAISTIAITFDDCKYYNTDNIKAAYVLVSTNADYSEAAKYPVTIAKGEVEVKITTPAKGCYYKLVIEMGKCNNNGEIQISKLVYSE